MEGLEQEAHGTSTPAAPDSSQAALAPISVENRQVGVLSSSGLSGGVSETAGPVVSSL
jgi:hypothetical protein